ncbi:MAG TPA: glycerophosphodiester phosphodiesterase family protein [Nitrospiraceae bacterium]|nr:glycerophosphodiester phosphodiesterase family protein [Nitrospiraceae bacterium]
MAKETRTTRYVLRIGHRGAAGHAPENTLVSIQKAIDMGCDLVEVDVQRTRDGQLVLLHDERVDRTTNGTGEIATMLLAELRTLEAGGGQRIPTLEAALRMANGRVGLILELKASGIGEQVCELVRKTGFTGPVIYASFIHKEVLRVREAAPTAATMALFKKLPQDPVAVAVNARATHVGLRWDTATKPLIKAFHGADFQVFVYTVNKPSDIQRMRTLGVDGIVSDYPDRL